MHEFYSNYYYLIWIMVRDRREKKREKEGVIGAVAAIQTKSQSEKRKFVAPSFP